MSAIVGTGLLFITLRRKIGGFGLKEISKSFIKIGLASVVMGLIALGSFNFSKEALMENMALIIAIGIGAIVYGILIYSAKIPEVEQILAVVKKKLEPMIRKSKEDS